MSETFRRLNAWLMNLVEPREAAVIGITWFVGVGMGSGWERWLLASLGLLLTGLSVVANRLERGDDHAE